MSKLGEIADRILEMLKEGGNISQDELEKKVPLPGAEILNFMSQEGLIELKKGEVRITDFGRDLISVE